MDELKETYQELQKAITEVDGKPNPASVKWMERVAKSEEEQLILSRMAQKQLRAKGVWGDFSIPERLTQAEIEKINQISAELEGKIWVS